MPSRQCLILSVLGAVQLRYTVVHGPDASQSDSSIQRSYLPCKFCTCSARTYTRVCCPCRAEDAYFISYRPGTGQPLYDQAVPELKWWVLGHV